MFELCSKSRAHNFHIRTNLGKTRSNPSLFKYETLGTKAKAMLQFMQ